LIEVVRALQEPHEVERKCHREALARGPWYLQARTSYMHGLTPQWGGSIPQMKKYVAECEEAARHYPLAGLLALEPIGYEAGAAKEAYQVYASTSNWPVIAHVYDRILSRYPDAGLYRSQYAWYAYKARKYEVAAEQFERLGDRYFPGGYWDNLSYYSVSRAYAYNARGWIDLQADRLQTGMPWLLKGLEYNPRDPWPMAKLATCYHRLGNAEKTAEWARKALANSPSNLDKQEAENELAWAESQKKR
jgi:tetratricopeptide (TPR) repeat protein